LKSADQSGSDRQAACPVFAPRRPGQTKTMQAGIHKMFRERTIKLRFVEQYA
jgi:hypothetical protein